MISDSTNFNFSSSRPISTRLNPFLDNCKANSFPMPSEAPVTTFADIMKNLKLHKQLKNIYQPNYDRYCPSPWAMIDHQSLLFRIK